MKHILYFAVATIAVCLMTPASARAEKRSGSPLPCAVPVQRRETTRSQQATI